MRMLSWKPFCSLFLNCSPDRLYTGRFWPTRFDVTNETIVSLVTSNLTGQNQPVRSRLSNQFLYSIQCCSTDIYKVYWRQLTCSWITGFLQCVFFNQIHMGKLSSKCFRYRYRVARDNNVNKAWTWLGMGKWSLSLYKHKRCKRTLFEFPRSCACILIVKSNDTKMQEKIPHTVLVLIKLTNIVVALRLRCGSCKLNFWQYFIIFR